MVQGRAPVKPAASALVVVVVVVVLFVADVADVLAEAADAPVNAARASEAAMTTASSVFLKEGRELGSLLLNTAKHSPVSYAVAPRLAKPGVHCDCER
jgi:hypothetical protein